MDTSRVRTGAHHDHAVQFYHTEDFLYDVVSRFLLGGISAGTPAIVFAGPARIKGFSDRLRVGGYDARRAEASGQVTLVDARAVLSAVMRGDAPDEDLFREHVEGSILKALNGRGNGHGPAGIRAYGEMVDLLWRDGNPAGAIRLEELWNDLMATRSVNLLCAYSMGNFYRAADGSAFETVCDQHARVFPAESDGGPGSRPEWAEDRTRELCILQQRARALEHEIEQRKKLESALRDALAERRRSEEALRRSEREADRAIRAKSEFLAVMSHELRTPLTAILGYHELLSQELAGPTTPVQRSHLDRIRSGAEQLMGLVDQVLTFARLEAGQGEVTVKTVDVAALARDAAALLAPTAEAKGIRLDVRIPEVELSCGTDPGKLTQILLNLLANSVKFTDRGYVELAVGLDGDQVCISVRDTGIGIAAEDLDRIFEAFVQVDGSMTRDRGGTGLGLSVSRDLAAMIDCELAVESTPGEGSTFTLRITREPMRD